MGFRYVGRQSGKWFKNRETPDKIERVDRCGSYTLVVVTLYFQNYHRQQLFLKPSSITLQIKTQAVDGKYS